MAMNGVQFNVLDEEEQAQSERDLSPWVGTAMLLRPLPEHFTSPAPLKARRKKMTDTLRVSIVRHFSYSCGTI